MKRSGWKIEGGVIRRLSMVWQESVDSEMRQFDRICCHTLEQPLAAVGWLTESG